MLLPVFSEGQTLKINAGFTASTTIPPSGLDIPTGVENILFGCTATAGIDYSETRWGFLSSNIGFIQKGRKEDVTYTDPLGNEIETKTKNIRYSYATINTTMNFKLSQGSLIPFFSIGPRVDYLINQNDFYDPKKIKFGFGLNGGLGLMKRLNKLDFGVRLDYLLNLAEQPKDRTGAAQFFCGYRFK